MSVTGMPTSPSTNLGNRFGNDIYELTRRRFASQGAATRGRLGSQFAARGATGSGAASFAERDLRNAELRALGESSINSRVQGTQLGLQEQGRLDQLDLSNRSLAQQRDIAFAGFDLQRELEAKRREQEMQMALLMEQWRRSQQKSGLWGAALGGIGSFLGGTILPGVGNYLGGNWAKILGGGGKSNG